MAITTRDGMVAALAGSQRKSVVKVPTLAGKGAGSFHSYWTVPGLPGAGAAAGSLNGAIHTDATVGAIPFNNPVSPALTYIGKLSLGSTLGAFFELYDRLWANSALSGTVTTAQAITQPALTRYTSGEGVEIWLEWYTATGATSVTATVAYTNQANAAKTTTVTVPVSPVAGQMLPVPLAAGDTGARSVQSVTLSATTGTAGNFGVTLLKTLVELGIPNANTGEDRGPFDLGLPQVSDDACLALLCLLPGTVVPTVNGALDLAQG